MLSQKLQIEDVHNTLVSGIKKFVTEAGSTKVIVGLSGGIDSAVVASLAVRALGSQNVHAFMMPSEFSTIHSVQDAIDLATALNINYNVINIASIYNKFMKELAPVFGDNNKWNVAEENLQARIRANLLMAYANKFGALVLNTSNKSELFTGYGTLYGDLAGAAMVIADLYKCEVYELANYINKDGVVIPLSTITKAPSAELKVGQKDSDSLPDYPILDPILYAMHECGKSPEEIIAEGASKEVVDQILKLKSKSAFKVSQIPPIFNIGEKPIAYKEKWLF